MTLLGDILRMEPTELNAVPTADIVTHLEGVTQTIVDDTLAQDDEAIAYGLGVWSFLFDLWYSRPIAAILSLVEETNGN